MGSGCVWPSEGCWPVAQYNVLLAVKVFFQVDIPGLLAPAVLRDAACDIAQRLHGAPAQAFSPEGTPNIKPPARNHMCSHKWWVVYSLGMVYLTLNQLRMYQGKRMPYLFVQGSVGQVMGVARLFSP